MYRVQIGNGHDVEMVRWRDLYDSGGIFKFK